MKKISIFFIILYFLLSFSAYANLAFVANLDGNWDLFFVNEYDLRLVRLTKTPYDEKEPSLSSDGTKIVYATSDGHLNIVDTVTKKSNQVAVGKRSGARITPCFSPNGQYITFAQFKSPDLGDDTELLTMNLETKTLKKVIDQCSIQMWPAWSPDGNKIVYSNMHCSAECGRIIQELWIADSSEKWARQLLLTHSFCQQPVWSQTGTKIAFSSDQSGNFDIWVVDLTNWKMEQITTYMGLDVKPAWSPDGLELAFVSTRSGIMEIWIKNLKDGSLRPLRPFKDKQVECKDVTW
jgi:TolB protein